jgi:hypothetical protein
VTRKKLPEIWCVPQSGRKRPGARPAPDYFRVAREIEAAMRALRIRPGLDSVEGRAEEYAKLLDRQVEKAPPQTAKQQKAHLNKIYGAALRLALAIEDAGSGIEKLLEKCPRTRFEMSVGILTAGRSAPNAVVGPKRPTVSHVHFVVRWIADAAASSVPESTEKDFVEEVWKLAAEDYYGLTGRPPTASQRVRGDGFLDFLAKVFVALGIRDESPTYYAIKAVSWFRDAQKNLKKSAPILCP